MADLFVYGTLKRSCLNARRMRGAKLLGDDEAADGFRLISLGSFPTMVASEDDGAAVKGELWRVTAHHLQALDHFESVHTGMFQRREVILRSGMPAQAYFFRGSVAGFPTVPGGAW